MDVCNLEDFKKAFFCLDELISKEYIENDLKDDGIVWPDGHV